MPGSTRRVAPIAIDAFPKLSFVFGGCTFPGVRSVSYRGSSDPSLALILQTYRKQKCRAVASGPARLLFERTLYATVKSPT